MKNTQKFKFSYRINAETCMACGTCEDECIFDAVYIDDNSNYAINPSNCTRCGKCFRACPVEAIVRIKHD